MQLGIYIGFIYIDPSVEQKIRHKMPALTGDEVREAIQAPSRAEAAWEYDPAHGWRVIAKGTSSAGRAILAALQPVDVSDGTWSLRTARVRN